MSLIADSMVDRKGKSSHPPAPRWHTRRAESSRVSRRWISAGTVHCFFSIVLTLTLPYHILYFTILLYTTVYCSTLCYATFNHAIWHHTTIHTVKYCTVQYSISCFHILSPFNISQNFNYEIQNISIGLHLNIIIRFWMTRRLTSTWRRVQGWSVRHCYSQWVGVMGCDMEC